MNNFQQISISDLMTLLNNNVKAYNIIKPFIQDIDNLFMIINNDLINQLKNEFENKMFMKQFLFDNNSIKIYSHKQYGYVKIINVNDKIFYII